ncbi:MAG: flavin reductase family protein [Gemmatimonadaceae bacterium]|nr:flavin reductase family protein [Gemmatimonadaceae bacterium]
MARVTGVDAAAFRAALARFASGVTVVSARAADGSDHGMTVSAFTSLSLDPPLVLACIDRDATLLPHVFAAECFGVSILAADQAEASVHFARQDVVRFDGIPVERVDDGPALLPGAAAQLVCRRTATHDGGDHVIVIGEVLSARVLRDDPLLYALRQYGRFVAGAPTNGVAGGESAP